MVPPGHSSGIRRLLLLLVGEELLEGSIRAQRGEVFVVGEFLSGREAFIEGHAEIFDGAVKLARTDAAARHVVVHRAAVAHGGWVYRFWAALVVEDIGIKRHSLLVGLPALVVFVLGEREPGHEAPQNRLAAEARVELCIAWTLHAA